MTSNTPRRNLCILGATGSVGRAALAAAEVRGDNVEVLAAGENTERMHALCLQHRPRLAVMHNESAAEQLASLLKEEDIEVNGGQEAVCRAAADDRCCTVIAGIAGAGGLSPVLAAAKRGRRILIANKEALVFAGKLLMQTAKENGGVILPIDSEHAALFDLLQDKKTFAKLWLTASGGALRDMPLSQLAHATPEQVLAHPVWNMGAKITVDSATMMNKVLEVIEASVLFNAPADDIGVVLHPQSIVHAFVQDADGTLTAQMATPDMRIPLARMLSWPEASPVVAASPDWQTLSSMSFDTPDPARYPCLTLAQEALNAGGAAAAALSAANETAVARFLSGKIKFADIADINTRALETCAAHPADSLDDLRAADEFARELAGA